MHLSSYQRACELYTQDPPPELHAAFALVAHGLQVTDATLAAWSVAVRLEAARAPA
jgi:hypothetical protein